jgi:hypothetical protein
MREKVSEEKKNYLHQQLQFWDIKSLASAWVVYANAEYRDKAQLWELYVAIRDNKVKLTH